MERIVTFYNLISPLVPPENFCMDTTIKIGNIAHSPCPEDINNSNFVAGIKRKKNGDLQEFFKKSYNQESSLDSETFIKMFMILILIYIYFKYNCNN